MEDKIFNRNFLSITQQNLIFTLWISAFWIFALWFDKLIKLLLRENVENVKLCICS
jgi:hypothetical protein